jgi:hypothetical protein
MNIARAVPGDNHSRTCRRCRRLSPAAGGPALAAVDGSPATPWQPADVPATITVPLSSYVLLGSRDGKHWQSLARVKGRKSGTVDKLRFAAAKVSYLRLKETAATGGEPPLLEELETTG